MESIVIKNRIGIKNSENHDIHDIKIETRDSINSADIDIIKQVLAALDLSSNYNIRYKPAKKGSHETSIAIELSNHINKENAETAFWVISSILTLAGGYYTTKLTKYNSEIKKEKLKQEKTKTEKAKMILDELKDSYRVKRNINKKYSAMTLDEEVKYNENSVSYKNNIQEIKENRSQFSARISNLKPSKDSKVFFGVIRIHSLVVDGDNKWTGYFLDEDIYYKENIILKKGQSISFKLEDNGFKEGIVSDDSLSIDLTIYAKLEARIEITDEIKVKDFVILQVFKDQEKMKKALKVNESNNLDLFNFVGLNLK